MARKKSWQSYIKHISPSAVSQLLYWCARQWEYQHVFLYKGEGTHISAVFGDVIHTMAYLFFKKRHLKSGRINIGFKDRKKFVNSGARIWYDTLGEKIGPKGYGTKPILVQSYSEKQKEGYTGLIYSTLNLFWESNIAYRDNPAIFPETEVSFANIFIKGKFFNHQIGGRIDRIQPIPEEGGEEIWDYKTSRDIVSSSALSQETQPLFYHVMYYLKRGRNPLGMRIKAVRYGAEVAIPFNSEAMDIGNRMSELVGRLDRYKGMIFSILHRQASQIPVPDSVSWYKKSRRFPKNPGDPQCLLCSFKKICLSDCEEETTEDRLKMEKLKLIAAERKPGQLVLDMEFETRTPYWTQKRLLRAALRKNKEKSGIK